MRFLILLIPSLLFGYAQLIELGVGVFDVTKPKDASLEFRIEYKPGCVWHTIRPLSGLMITEKKQWYVYTGFGFDWVIANYLLFSPNFALGWYEKGDGKDLGFPLEFRSGVELGIRFSEGLRLGVHFYHLSNASLGRINPGSESLVLFFSKSI